MDKQTVIVRQRPRAAITSPLDTFIVHACRCAQHFGVTHKELRTAYLVWCRENYSQPMTDSLFCSELTARGFRERTGSIAGWDGLRLLD